MTERYTYIWEYQVAANHVPEFLRHYGPGGTWVRLFQRGEGYVTTMLLRDTERPGRFMTVDAWESEAAFRRFRQDHAPEFEALDRQCEALTIQETSHGQFEVVSSPG